MTTNHITVTNRIVNRALAIWKRKKCGPECGGCRPLGKDYTLSPAPPAWANPKRAAGWPFVPLAGPGADGCFNWPGRLPTCHRAGWWQS